MVLTATNVTWSPPIRSTMPSSLSSVVPSGHCATWNTQNGWNHSCSTARVSPSHSYNTECHCRSQNLWNSRYQGNFWDSLCHWNFSNSLCRLGHEDVRSNWNIEMSCRNVYSIFCTRKIQIGIIIIDSFLCGKKFSVNLNLDKNNLEIFGVVSGRVLMGNLS